MTTVQLIIMIIIYAISTSGFAMNLLIGEGLTKPIVVGVIVGLIMGDVSRGLELALPIQLMYMGVTAFGGIGTVNEGFASWVAVPIAFAAGLTPEVAVALAIPFGTIGVLATNINKTVFGIYSTWADKHCANANINGMTRCAFLYPILTKTVTGTLPLAIILIVGPDAASFLLNLTPAFILNGLAVVGMVLPALGFAMFIRTMGKGQLIPVFVVGYYVVWFLKLPIMACAIFGAAFGYFYVLFTSSEQKEEIAEQEQLHPGATEELEEHVPTPETDPSYRKVPLKTAYHCLANWYMFWIMSMSWERAYNMGFTMAMIPALKVLYPGEENKEGLADAMSRHNSMYFLSDVAFCSAIVALCVLLEEQKANGVEEVTGATISGIKAGLMGTMAGIGDSLIGGTIRPLLLAMAAGLAVSGSAIGAIIYPFGMMVARVTPALIVFPLVLRSGKDALKNLTGGWFQKITLGASVMGQFVMGAMASTYVNIKTSIVLSSGVAEAGATEVALQTFLDNAFPGLLGLGSVMLFYYLMSKKNVRPNTLMLIALAVSVVLGALKILG